MAGKHRGETSLGLWIFTVVSVIVFVLGILALISDN